MDLGIRGAVALITGGARGIGYACAEALAAEGARIALADIDESAVISSAEQLKKSSGAAVIGLALDIGDLAQVKAAVDRTEKALGPLAILVSSAAIVDDKLFIDLGPSDWHRVIDVCLYGPMNVIHAVLPGMIERRYGRVICLASDSARIGQARLSYYAAAKAGVIALTKSVAQEVGRNGITLNVVSPGATNTELRRAREQKLREQMGEETYMRRQKNVLRMYPVGRLGEPVDVAMAITFLASKPAGWVTGQILSINGGFVMP